MRRKAVILGVFSTFFLLLEINELSISYVRFPLSQSNSLSSCPLIISLGMFFSE